VYSATHGLRWWVEYQEGITTDALIAYVKLEYAGTDYETDYLHAIRTVTESPGLARAIAQASGKQATT
jgi:hypothetical protein